MTDKKNIKGNTKVGGFQRQNNNIKKTAANTRLCALAADVHFAGFAPAFTLSLGDSERSRKPPNAHSLGR
jgi:hypothetical protein